MKYKMVPVDEIEKLEQARKNLFNLLNEKLNSYEFMVLHDEVTDIMWKIGNTKYQEIEGPR